MRKEAINLLTGLIIFAIGYLLCYFFGGTYEYYFYGTTTGALVIIISELRDLNSPH